MTSLPVLDWPNSGPPLLADQSHQHVGPTNRPLAIAGFPTRSPD